ncbi:membrane bound c2 domain-containing protein [Xylona heveae TC161]|uniref:Membrane bound c2 domain-containing protein n=1 Tax=Xylona heveae (strain CBS 132557 / TC161) TaxID=1328760 RepID=A0A165I531_XYLHT|nr:membrane bound c2 domain-containing protein [Xylona heveae TC161]KZF24395.1 membrane bound c2 domain-containing protein [Xylona heveae TC161]
MPGELSSRADELKQQGVAEAARDPDTNVTSEDAEKAIVNETRKAGGAAYQFDPDASPEEKAAQAQSRLPPGFHHEKKPQAVGVVTDINDNTPDQYDLPPPSKAGAVTPPKTAANGKPTGANGQVPEDERWARDRVGWAPRFGPGSFVEGDEEEVSMLDHQTWVESKLPDKFYGDWYHNTAVIIFACLASWLIAVIGGGLAWVILVMVVCGTYYRTSLRRVRRNFRDDVNREMAKQRLETDHESLEWINSFMVKFWPIYAPVLCDTIIASVDQVLSTSTPAFLDSMRMKTFILGTKPPRLEHVKTYPKAEDDVVLMDWKFSFTPNDVADMTARQIKNKINPKVVLEVRVGKAMVSKGLDVIVEDFAFSGLMRVKVKLQIPFPHIEKVEICFLERPTIDYVCKPLGGDTFGFDINFIPGLESFIMEQVHANLGPMMYDPNVFPIEIAKMLAGNPIDQAIGVVAITVHGAFGLKNPDKFSGTPDPYCVASLNGRTPLGKTKIVKENANPRWNETLYVIITSLSDSLTLQAFDFNDYRKDKELGTATFALDQLEAQPEHENLQLEVMANGKHRGAIQADVRYFPVLGGAKLEDGTEQPPPESNTGIARFTIEQAKDLDGTKSLIGQLNPYAALLLNGKEVHVTRKLKRTNNPIWDNGSKEFLVTDRKSARLGLVIKDDRDLATDPVVGMYQIKLDDMITMMEKGQEWYNLSGVKTGRAKMSLQWKPVALKGDLAGSGGYVTPVGVMRLHLKGARDLRNLETMGKSDPYVRVLLSGIEKGRTVTFKNNLNPDWDEVIYVPVHSTRERLTFDVMDEETLGKDRSLGSTDISVGDFMSQAENGEYLTHDKKEPRSELLRLQGKGVPKGKLNFTAAFYPCYNVVDPEEEEKEKKEKQDEQKAQENGTNGTNGTSSTEGRKSSEKDAVTRENEKDKKAGTIDTNLAKMLDQDEKASDEPKEAPKIRVNAEELQNYESGLIVFKLIEAQLSEANVHVEILMDDMAFPSYTSSRATTRKMTFNETGEAFVRELDFSKITLRLREKIDKKGEGDKGDHIVAKLQGNTIDTLRRCLYKPTTLTLKDSNGGSSQITVLLKYIPVKMHLDPSESINNMGNLRVDVLDAADLPSADRNGKSDPYCKFMLDGKDVFKTKVQKKTLHPAWNEFFEVPVKSRIAANFKVTVYDWDFGDKADFLGAADINLDMLEPFTPQEISLGLDGKSGTIRLKLLFKPDYVTRSRQGSSTFSGTFAAPGKIVGAPVKGVGMVGGGVVKGASFLTRGIRGKKKSDDGNGVDGAMEDGAIADSIEVPDSIQEKDAGAVANSQNDGGSMSSSHHRVRSVGQQSMRATTPGGGEQGSASFTILSASGYPPGAHVRVHIKQVSAKGAKDIHKTKAIKSSSGQVQWDHEAFNVNCAADTQFQVQVKDHGLFGSGDDLGEALFFIDDSASGGEKIVKAGSGSVTLRTNFTSADGASVNSSPKSTRKSFLGSRK